MQFIMIAVIMSLIPGCTAFYVPTIGERVHVPAEYQRALRLGDQLILFYRTDTRAGLDIVKSGSLNWSSINLPKIGWNTLDPNSQTSQIILGEAAVTIEDDPPPGITVPPYTEIPVRYIELREAADLAQFVARLRDSVVNEEISVNITLPNLMLWLVRKENDGKVLYKSVHIQGRHYQTWWALPARAAVVPGALAVDSVTWPAWLILFAGQH